MESIKSPALIRWNRESVLRYNAELIRPINEILYGSMSSHIVRLNYAIDLESFALNYYCISVSKGLLSHFAKCSGLKSYHPMNFSKEYFQFVYKANFTFQQNQNEHVRQMIYIIKKQYTIHLHSEAYNRYNTQPANVLTSNSTVNQNNQLLLDSSRQIYLQLIQSLRSNCRIKLNFKKHTHKPQEHVDSQTLIWAFSSHPKKRHDYIQKELGPFLKTKKTEEKLLFSPYKPYLLDHHYKLSKLDLKKRFVSQEANIPFYFHKKRLCEMSTEVKNFKNSEVTLKPRNTHNIKDLRDNSSRLKVSRKSHHFRNFASQVKKSED